MRNILLGTVLLAIAAATLTCTTNEVYVKLTKQSKVFASEETYEIWGNGQKLAPNPTFADHELRVSEFCIAATTWTNIISALGTVYDSSSFLIKHGYFNAGLFTNYRIQITSSSESSVNAYEMQLATCATVIPSNIEFKEQQYSYYANYHQVNIAPER